MNPRKRMIDQKQPQDNRSAAQIALGRAVALHLEGVIGRTLPGQVMRSGPWYRLPRG